MITSNTFRCLSFTQASKETTLNYEFVNIGPTPKEEKCTQLGNNTMDIKFECEVYIRQLIRYYSEPPAGCEFFIMKNDHELGIYYDVNLFYRTSVEEEEIYPGPSSTCIAQWSELENNLLLNENYALKVESGLEKWDTEALKELQESKHHLYIVNLSPLRKSA
jgi:hypothetical protein